MVHTSHIVNDEYSSAKCVIYNRVEVTQNNLQVPFSVSHTISYGRASSARTKYKEPVLIELMESIQCMLIYLKVAISVGLYTLSQCQSP